MFRTCNLYSGATVGLTLWEEKHKAWARFCAGRVSAFMLPLIMLVLVSVGGVVVKVVKYRSYLEVQSPALLRSCSYNQFRGAVTLLVLPSKALVLF